MRIKTHHRPLIEFKELMRTLRHQRGYTQEALADEIGVSLTSILAWERGVSPSIANLQKLATALGISWDSLLSCEFPRDQRSGVRT
jgi:transcriptional regulator with XRE-family HTH domain